MTQPNVAILILGAGQSRRMLGADKLLELIEGQPLIRRQAQMALATRLPVWIALPPDRPLRNASLQGLEVGITHVTDASLGMSYSIKAGIAAIPADMAVIMWLADLPDITTDDLTALARAAQTAPQAIIRATTAAGKPGHPIVFPPAFRAELNALTGDDGAREILKRHIENTVFVALPGNRALTDLDTPDDWAQWRARNPA